MASLMPSPYSTWRSTRRRACTRREPAGHDRLGHGAAQRARSRTWRAISSITSTSSSQSGRHDGRPTSSRPPWSGMAVNPMASSSSTITAVGDRGAEQGVDPVRAHPHRAHLRRQVTPRVDRAGVHHAAPGRSPAAARRSGPRPGRCRTGPDRARSGSTPPSAARAGPPSGRRRPGSNHAISSATTVVASLISVSAPPMMPAMPIGRSSASQIRRSSAVKVRSTPSSVTRVSP